jgi:hypothetical protein
LQESDLVFTLYTAFNPSSRELKLLKNLHNTLPACLSLLVPSLGDPKLTASNCVPSKKELRTIFFENSEQMEKDSKVEDYNTMYGGRSELKSTEKNEYHISEKIFSSKQFLSFPNPLLPVSTLAMKQVQSYIKFLGT